MSQRISTGSLVLYKSRPARVTEVAEKIEIALADGKRKRVRDKDILLLHEGPVQRLDGLELSDPNLEETWELLADERVPLSELAVLLYGDFTPASAWSSWQLVAEGLYFSGTPEAISGRDPQQVAAEIAEREAKAARQAAWEALIERLAGGRMEEEDRKELAEVERLALGTAASSRILQTLGINESPEHAHRFLTRVGYWPGDFNPHPRRFEAPGEPVRLALPDLPQENRLDLTHLPAFAIDDDGNEDPDDALSLEGDRLWVHVADVAALVTPDSELDIEARVRGANLYLPEGVVGMLPDEATGRLGLGLQEVSPALSIGLRLNEAGEPHDIRIEPSWVRVSRLSYREASLRLDESPLREIEAITRRYRARRLAADAARIDLPEASVSVVGEDIRIRPIEKLPSRDLVTDAMVMAGEAVARFALEQDLAIPFVGQPEPEEIRQPATASDMYAYRRLFKPSSASTLEQPHFGLGLSCYTRTTSPLRRYMDLLTHQQLRALIQGGAPLSREELGRRIAESESGALRVRRTERMANQHWKLVFLQRNPDWRGDAVVVELAERWATVIIAELALEARVKRHPAMALDNLLKVAPQEIDLADLRLRLRVLD